MSRRMVLSGLAALLVVCASAALGAAPAEGGKAGVIPPDPLVVGKVRHALLLADNRQGLVLRVSAEGTIVWSCPAPNVHDAWLLAAGNVLFCYSSRTACGVKVVTPDKKEVFHYQLPQRVEIHACQPLAGGNVMIGATAPARVIEIDRKGQVVKTVPLISKSKSPHLHLRQVRQLANGNYLVCHVGDRVVREYDAKGKLLREITGVGQCKAAVRLPGGNTLVSGGGDCVVTEVDAAGKIVWQITKKDIPQIRADWLSGLCRLPNGNTVITNWLGHGKLGQGVPLFEITRDKRIVWMFTDSRNTKAITGVQVLAEDGQLLKGPVLR